MKQFVITIPNPVRGKGARGFDRKPKRGEPTFSIFHCYARSEKRARELTARHFDMRKVPDGTRFVEIVSDPRIVNESFVDMRTSMPVHPLIIESAPVENKRFEVTVVNRAVQQDTHVYEIQAATEEEALEKYKHYIEHGIDESLELSDSYSYHTDREEPKISVAELITDGDA